MHSLFGYFAAKVPNRLPGAIGVTGDRHLRGHAEPVGDTMNVKWFGNAMSDHYHAQGATLHGGDWQIEIFHQDFGPCTTCENILLRLDALAIFKFQTLHTAFCVGDKS